MSIFLPETAGAEIIALDVARLPSVAAKKSPATALWGRGGARFRDECQCAGKHPRRRDHSAGRGRCQGNGAALLHQHDPPHRPAGDALDAGQQLDFTSPAATSIVAHALDDIAEQHVPPVKVGLDKGTGPFRTRSHLMRSIQDGNAANGSSTTSAPVGSGSFP